MTVGFLWLAGVAALRDVVELDVPLVTVPPDDVAVPFLMVDVPAALVAVVLRFDDVLDIVPELLPDTPFTVEPPLSEVLVVNTLFDPV